MNEPRTEGERELMQLRDEAHDLVWTLRTLPRVVFVPVDRTARLERLERRAAAREQRRANRLGEYLESEP